jgi:hypothetical protein
MNAEPSPPTPDPVPAVSAGAHPVNRSSSGAAPTGATRRPPLWLLTLGAGLVSGLISWAGGEAAFIRFRTEREIIYPRNYKQISGYEKQAVTTQIVGAARLVAERKKAAASFGLLGLVLALSLGLIGGWEAGSSRAAMRGAGGGGLAGAAVGIGLSWATVPLFFRFENPETGFTTLVLTHAAIFIGIGGASGLALGLGLGDRPAMVRALFGGLLGGFLGTAALATVYSLAFPLMRTLEPVASERTARLSMYLCEAVCTALLTGLAAGGRARKPRVAHD